MTTNDNMPLVSVIIPTYKRPDTLDRAIDTVLNQTYLNIEVIVVDDNNPYTEGRLLTEKKMEAYKDNPRVKYIKHERNKNGSAARNTGARASKGEFIAFLDDDDQFLSKKIESQVKKLMSLSDEWGFCYNNYYTQRGDGPLIPVKEHREGNLYLTALKQDISVNAGSNLLIRRAAYESINGFDESFKRNQDHEFLVRLLKQYKMAYVEEPGLIYSVGTTNVKVEYEEVIARYKEAFKSMIEELSPEDRKEFDRNVNRLRFFHMLKRKKYKKALGLITDGELSLFDALSYCFKMTYEHLMRKLQK